MPFTFAMLRRSARLALAAFPLHLGLLLQGRDPRLRGRSAAAGTRIFYVGGYIGALLTAIYTFRIDLPRRSAASPCEEAARARARPPRTTPSPTNPATGELEDTDVGFPGPEHHIAERDVADEVAMGVARGARASSPASSRSRGRPTWLPNFLEPTFADSIAPSTRRHQRRWRRSASSLGAVISVGSASRSPTASACRRPGPRDGLAASASARCTACLVNKWYFDELIDARRSSARRVRSAASAATSFERIVVNGALVGGTTGVVRAGLRRGARAADRLPAQLRAASLVAGARRSSSSTCSCRAS